MEPAHLLEHLFDKKKLNVLRQFYAQPEREWTLVELAKSARVPNATTYRILNKLLSLELLEERKIKHLKTYMLAQNDSTKYLSKMFETGESALESFVEQVSKLENVEAIIMHGKQSKEKANVLIIGSRIDTSAINDITRNVAEKFKFTIITLAIDAQQYEQMVSMGLYSGTKKELYKTSSF